MTYSTRAPGGSAVLCALVASSLLWTGCPAEDGGGGLPGFPPKDTGSDDVAADVTIEPDVPPDPDAAVVAIVSPEAGLCVSTTLEVQVEATHESGIAKVELFADGAALVSAETGDDDIFTLSVDLVGRADGPLSLSVVATPVTGPQGKAKLDIIVDNTPPALELERPIGNEVVMGELRARGLSTDDGCGIASVATKLTGSDEDLDDMLTFDAPAAEQPFDRRLDASDMGSFAGVVEVRVLDAAGNEATASRQVYVVRPLRFLEASSHRPEDAAKFSQIVGGDWDGDGLADIFMPTAKGVLVSRSEGDGTFADPLALTTESTTAVEPVDLDGDGDLDLIAASSGKPAKLSILIRGEGDVLVKEHTVEVPDSLAANDVVLVDLTGDEILDVVVTTNSDQKSVVVFVGYDDSHYADKPEGERRFFSDQPKSFGGVANVRDAKAGDFNGDGNMDLALGSKGDSKISVFLGDGSGGFLAANDTVVDEDAIALASGYFSGGASLDLIVASEKSGKLYLLAGQGNGYFSVSPLPIIGGKPTSIVTGHFNEDDKLDFAVAYTGAKDVSVFHGGALQGIGASYVAGNAPSSAIAGQFTSGDSAVDIVVMNGVDQRFTLLTGNGDGTFVAAPKLDMPLDCAGDKCVPAKPTAMAVADFDTVAGLDVAFVTTIKPEYLDVYFYGSNGTWPTYPLSAALLPSKFHVNEEEEYKGTQKGAVVDITSGDFNGDGLADIAIATQTKFVENPYGDDNPVSIDVLMKKAIPGFEFDVLDGFWAGLHVGTIVVEGKEKLDPDALKRSQLAKIVDIETGDMNSDGMSDLLVLTAFGSKAIDDDGKPNTAAKVGVFQSVGKGAFVEVARSAVDADAQSDPGPVKLMVGDVNLDGDNDVVVLNNKISDVAVLYNTDVLADGQLVSVVSTNPVAAALHQMNEDSDSFLDVLSVGKDMRVSFGRAHAIGEQPFETPLSYSNYPGKKPTSIGAADFNGDGLEDVVIADGSTSVVYLYANIGDRQFAKDPVIIHTAPLPKSMVAKDIDGDTCVDLVLLGDGGVTILRNLLCD